MLLTIWSRMHFERRDVSDRVVHCWGWYCCGVRLCVRGFTAIVISSKVPYTSWFDDAPSWGGEILPIILMDVHIVIQTCPFPFPGEQAGLLRRWPLLVAIRLRLDLIDDFTGHLAWIVAPAGYEVAEAFEKDFPAIRDGFLTALFRLLLIFFWKAHRIWTKIDSFVLVWHFLSLNTL